MQYKILLIDDDMDDRTFFRDAVELASHGEVLCIALDDGHDLLPTLSESDSNRPHVIFTDINMPTMSGWEILSLLQENDKYKDIPVIMYSTSKHAEEITRAKTLGALCFFNKPSDFDDLQSALAEVIIRLKNGTIDQLCEDSKMFF